MTDKILQLDIHKRSCEAIVKDLMPTINHYRSEGGKLSDIYAALCRKRLLTIEDNSSQMALGTFRNWYYKHRKIGGASPKKTRKVVKEVAIEAERTPDLLVPPPDLSDSSDDESSELMLAEQPEEELPTNRKGFKRLELGGTLEEQFETGAMYFRKQ